MTEYDITIEGVEDGLTATALEGMAMGAFPNADNVEVVESESTED